MKLPLIACTALTLAACATTEVTRTTIVSSVTPEQQTACTQAAASARSVPEAMVMTTGAEATATGPVVTMMVGGTSATCKLDELGQVQDVTFGM